MKFCIILTFAIFNSCLFAESFAEYELKEYKKVESYFAQLESETDPAKRFHALRLSFDILSHIHIDYLAEETKILAYSDELEKIIKPINEEYTRQGRSPASFSRALDAQHRIDIVKGRIALKNGRTAEAATRLLKASHAQPTPVLANFGPNLRLASELLVADFSMSDTVIEYLDNCQKFWKGSRAGDTQQKIANWKAQILHGNIPKFTPNDSY